jgi:hypothetical protein
MKKILAVSGLMALLAVGVVAKNQRWTGYVSDAKCGAKVDAACAKRCIEAGEKVVFVNDGDKTVIPVANPEALKGHEGHHVLVEGKLENNTLTVSKVKMVDDAKKVNDPTY